MIESILSVVRNPFVVLVLVYAIGVGLFWYFYRLRPRLRGEPRN